MYIEQLYTNCLSEAAYYIESNGEAAIIDPLRDIEDYLAKAADRKATIKYIFETHFHADFVSGHLDLGKATGASIIYGPGTKAAFDFHLAKDGEVFKLGNITIQALHTPGHTVESTCYLLQDEQGKPHAIFTGDTLFVGDVGRPDLSSGDKSTEELAGMLYDSLQTKIMPLANDIIVYPAHGPGSSCGKNIGPATQSTIGSEKESNYALQPQSKEAFIEIVSSDIPTAPQYFPINAKINQQGYASLEEVLKTALSSLSIVDFKAQVANGAVILDTRNAHTFMEGFIPGAISIGLEGRFAEWAGSILSFDEPIVLVTEPGKEKETAIRLARVGFDKINGYLNGGYDAWKNAAEKIDLVIDVEPDELAMDIPFDEHLVVLDVRREAEFAGEHVKDAINIPLSDMKNPANMAILEENQNIYVHCAGGYRSVIAASLLKRQGIHNIRNINGGWNKIKEQEGIETEKDPTLLN